MTSETPAAVLSLSFEEALKQLEDIVGRLERGDAALEESIELYARGDQLRRHCDKLLKAAEAKVERIQLTQDGAAAGTAPLDVE